MIVKSQTLINIAINSSILEIRTWPKPGNVHKTQNFPSTIYNDFLVTAYSSQSMWEDLILDITDSDHKSSRLFVSYLLKTVNHMMRIQTGGNVLLGHYLLLLPLFISAGECFRDNNRMETTFWINTRKIIHNSSANDTHILYQALRAAKPGSMGNLEKYDIYNDNYKSELTQDNVNLEKIFELSKQYDSISKELASNYSFIRETVLPKMDEIQLEYPGLLSELLNICQKEVIREDIIDLSPDLNAFLIRIFLYILSEQLDTLISRKMGFSKSQEISIEAHSILNQYSQLKLSDWIQLVLDFDKKLQKAKGKLNPGTTADLLACSLFIYITKKSLLI